MSKESYNARPPIYPSGQSTLSTILNGAGNGTMLASIAGFGAIHGPELFGKKPLASKDGKFFVIVGTAGALLGAVHGYYESRHIQKFRESIANRVNVIDQEAGLDRAKLNELHRQVQAHASAHEKAR